MMMMDSLSLNIMSSSLNYFDENSTKNSTETKFENKKKPPPNIHRPPATKEKNETIFKQTVSFGTLAYEYYVAIFFNYFDCTCLFVGLLFTTKISLVSHCYKCSVRIVAILTNKKISLLRCASSSSSASSNLINVRLHLNMNFK